MESAKNSHSGQVSMILGVFAMYISSNSDQLTIEDFFMPFDGNLLKTNRWVKLENAYNTIWAVATAGWCICTYCLKTKNKR